MSREETPDEAVEVESLLVDVDRTLEEAGRLASREPAASTRRLAELASLASGLREALPGLVADVDPQGVARHSAGLLLSLGVKADAVGRVGAFVDRVADGIAMALAEVQEPEEGPDEG